MGARNRNSRPGTRTIDRVETREQSSQNTETSTPDAARSAQDPLGAKDFFHSLSWADRMEEHDSMLEAMQLDRDVAPSEDGESEHDAKGTKLFPTSERTESFLRQPFSTPLVNATRRQLRDKFGAPNQAFTTSPHLDKVLKARVSPATKAKDKDLAKLQALALDAVGPLTRIVEDACDGTLTAKDNLDAVQTALKFLGNFAAHYNRARRIAVLQNLNTRIVDMAEEDGLYRDAGLSLFGEGFCRKAKERDDEMKALNSMSAKTSSREGGKAFKPPFFPGTPATEGSNASLPTAAEGSRASTPTTRARRRATLLRPNDQQTRHLQRRQSRTTSRLRR